MRNVNKDSQTNFETGERYEIFPIVENSELNRFIIFILIHINQITLILKALNNRFKICIKSLVFLVLMNLFSVNGQMLQDSASAELARKCIDNIYDLQFENARELIIQINRSYPEHPVVSLLRGILTYWENYPMVHTNPSHVSFEDDMRKCIKLSEENTNTDYEIEYLLADLCARGMLLMFYADNDLAMEVIPLATSSYKYLMRSFDYNEFSIDLNYFTGIYNYYREAYPRIYPIYKSLAFMFPQGNEQTGLQQLRETATNSVLLRAEAYFSLAWIYLYYENNYNESMKYGKTLHDLYPGNMQYLAIYIKSLLLMRQYDEAEILVSEWTDKGVKNYFQAQNCIFSGIIQEKKHKNLTLAREYYNQGLAEISYFGDYGNEYASYAYYGLSRISEANNEKQEGKSYRRMAEKLSDFKKINFDK